MRAASSVIMGVDDGCVENGGSDGDGSRSHAAAGFRKATCAGSGGNGGLWPTVVEARWRRAAPPSRSRRSEVALECSDEDADGGRSPPTSPLVDGPCAAAAELL